MIERQLEDTRRLLDDLGEDVDRPDHGMTGVGLGRSAAQLTAAERERRRRARKATRSARKAHRR